jgi:hypothetical protein
MDSNVLTKLKALRELLGDRAKWSRCAYACDKQGYAVAPLSERACSWCLLGGVEKVYGEGVYSEMNEVTNALYITAAKMDMPETKYLSRINDSLGYVAVITLIDKTIQEQQSN